MVCGCYGYISQRPKQIEVGSPKRILVSGMFLPSDVKGLIALLEDDYVIHVLHGDIALSQEILSSYGTLILIKRPLSWDDATLINNYVRSGGRVLILEPPVQTTNRLTKKFNITVNDDDIEDFGESVTTKITEHEITQNIDKLDYLFASSLSICAEKATVLVRCEEHAYSEFYTNSPPIMAVHNQFKFIVVTADLFTSAHVSENSYDIKYEGCQNPTFLINILKWLTN